MGERLREREQQDRERAAHQPVGNPEHRGPADLPDAPTAGEPQRDGAREVPRSDDQHGRVEMAAPPQRAHRQRRGDAAQQAQEQRRRVVEHRLRADHGGHDHRADHRHPAVEQDGEHHRLERQRDQLGMAGPRVGDGGGAEQRRSEQQSDERHLALFAVGLAPVEHHQHPEHAEHQRVAEHRPHDAAERRARRGAAAHQLVVQRLQLLVRGPRDDLSRRGKPVPLAHHVLARVHAAHQLAAPPPRLRLVRHERRAEEAPHELQVHHVAHARPRIGVHRPRAQQVLVVAQHLVASDGLLRSPAPHDQLSRSLGLQHPRPGADDGLRPLADGVAERLEERVQLGRRAVVDPLLKLIERLGAGGEILRLARQLLVGLGHDEVERRDDVAPGLRSRLEQRPEVGGARGERQIREHREADHPRPARPVVAHFVPARSSHLSLEHPRHTRG